MPPPAPARIYVVHDDADRAAAEAVETELFDAGGEPALLPVGVSAEDHRKEFEACDAVLVVWGVAPADWAKQKLRDFHRAEKEDRSRPFQGRAMCLCPPDSQEKSRFRSNVFATLRPGDGSVAGWVRRLRGSGP
jgi:hypothetical protein